MILLHRIDAAANMRRYYRLDLQPTLFGDVALVRQWGRIGRGRGQVKTETFATVEAAALACAELARRKCRRGYREATGWLPGSSFRVIRVLQSKPRTSTMRSGVFPYDHGKNRISHSQ
jgi:predicted DNA-binding WGR domain protein